MMLFEKKTQKRRDEITQMIAADGKVRVSDLSEHFDVSSVTIRKDLEYLEATGVLQRVHGGAISVQPVRFGGVGGEYTENKAIHRELKQSVARAAAALIHDGDSVLIHSGSTTYYVAEELKKKKDLVVVTNVFKIVEQLWDCEGITSFFLGGRVYHRDHMTIGESVLSQLSTYSIDKLIMSADGVDLASGITTSYTHREDYIIHQMIQQSKMTIVVADETKIGKKMLMRLADIDQIDILVTNRSEEKEGIYQEIERRGVRVIRAE